MIILIIIKRLYWQEGLLSLTAQHAPCEMWNTHFSYWGSVPLGPNFTGMGSFCIYIVGCFGQSHTHCVRSSGVERPGLVFPDCLDWFPLSDLLRRFERLLSKSLWLVRLHLRIHWLHLRIHRLRLRIHWLRLRVHWLRFRIHQISVTTMMSYITIVSLAVTGGSECVEFNVPLDT